jgi:pyruvate-formate lyase-activating enzyme
MKRIPKLVYSDESGQIFDHPFLEMLGQSGRAVVEIDPETLIPLPPGSELFSLPGRLPLGADRRAGRRRVLSRLSGALKGRPRAVAAFISPAYTRLLSTAYVRDEAAAEQPILPLFAYSPVGYLDGRFWVPALRVDADTRQELSSFRADELNRLVAGKRAEMPHNRLVEHLSHCAQVYRCPAAQNFFYDRFEAPMPVSPSCNSACVGCISLQNEPGRVASHDRIRFVPEPDELVEMAAPHLEQAPRPLVSFGQGCEGEPLNQGPVLEEAIRRLRARTQRGRVHLNTNGSRPALVARLVQAGLDSIRVSLNSAVEATYNAYYRPIGYRLADVVQSIHEVVRGGGWASINLLVFPGVTDRPEEIEALEGLLRSTGLHMVQMRNLNIDPELYLDALRIGDERPGLGIGELMRRLERARPGLRFGYFNPPAEDGAPLPPPEAAIEA